MQVLKEEELLNINGGALSVGAWLAIGGGVVFLIGVLDGLMRPLPCNC